jgi:flagellar assembly protein FliH
MQCAKKSVVSLIRSKESGLATAWEAPDIHTIAEQIVSEPEPSAEEIALQRAYQEGFAKGLAEGHAEGLKSGHVEGFQQGSSEARQQVEAQGRQQQEAYRAQAEEILSGLEPLVEGLKNPLESQLDETVNRAIATLVHQISTQVIKSELEVHPEHIVTVVQQLFQQLPMTEREVRFYLHPQDKALLEEGVQLSAGAFEWRMEADEEISRGGCHVESHNFSVDETVERRLAHSVRTVFGLSAEELAAEAVADPVAEEQVAERVAEASAVAERSPVDVEGVETAASAEPGSSTEER